MIYKVGKMIFYCYVHVRNITAHFTQHTLVILMPVRILKYVEKLDRFEGKKTQVLDLVLPLNEPQL